MCHHLGLDIFDASLLDFQIEQLVAQPQDSTIQGSGEAEKMKDQLKVCFQIIFDCQSGFAMSSYNSNVWFKRLVTPAQIA